MCVVVKDGIVIGFDIWVFWLDWLSVWYWGVDFWLVGLDVFLDVGECFVKLVSERLKWECIDDGILFEYLEKKVDIYLLFFKCS